MSEFPFSNEQDTTTATTDATDAALNEECGAPATDASVWYTFTAEEDLGVEVLVGDSDYSAGVIVAVGSPEELGFVTCGPVEVFFAAAAGETYFVLAFDDQVDGMGIGGILVIHIDAFSVEPPPEIELTVDPVGGFDPRSGVATISGTFLCEGAADFIEVDGELVQPVGRFAVQGHFFLFGGNGNGENGENGENEELFCDGTTQAWTADVTPDNGLFKGGKATVDVQVFACGLFDCTEETITQQVRLRGSR